MWIEIILSFFLVICALWDGYKKEIPLAMVWAGMLTAVILRAAGVMGEENWTALGAAFLPGVIFWMISFITREKVGYGDGWVLLMIGLFVGGARCFLILTLSLIMESVILLLLLAFHKIHGDTEIPFAPFLLLGLGVVVCL